MFSTLKICQSSASHLFKGLLNTSTVSRTLTRKDVCIRGLRQEKPIQHSKNVNLLPQQFVSESAVGNVGLNLLKGVTFTAGFCSVVYVGAAICQYERTTTGAESSYWGVVLGFIKFQLEHLYDKDVWKVAGKEWHLKEGDKVFWPVCLMNVVVYACWKWPAWQSTMVHYFCSNPAAKILCWPMLFSTFSHYAFIHIAMNMYVLHSFSMELGTSMGREQLLAMYLCGGVVSSLVSNAHKLFTRKSTLSLGASGAILAIIGYYCTKRPNEKLGIVFIPGWSFSAENALKGILALDLLGMLFRWKIFDHAAHFGGAMFGIAYATYGQKYFWENRHIVVNRWLTFRSAITGPPEQ